MYLDSVPKEEEEHLAKNLRYVQNLSVLAKPLLAKKDEEERFMEAAIRDGFNIIKKDYSIVNRNLPTEPIIEIIKRPF